MNELSKQPMRDARRLRRYNRRHSRAARRWVEKIEMEIAASAKLARAETFLKGHPRRK